MLVFVPEADILNILCNYQFVFSVLDELYVSHMLDVAGDVLRMHYKTMKCSVSISQGSVSTIFR